MANEVQIRVTAEDHATDTLRGIGVQAVSLGTLFGQLGADAVKSLAGLGKDAIGAGISFNAMKEQAQIAFTTMLGSGEKAKSFLDELQAFAARTPFEFPDLLRGAQRLQAMGFESSRVIPLMTNIGDAVAGLGGGAAEINRVVIALGQMQSRGKTTAQEMNQLTEVGIPAWRFLSDAIGKSIPEAMKLVEKGAINAQTTITAVTSGMNAEFGGMMAQQATTWNGMISTIKDNARILAGEVTGPLFDALRSTMQDFMSWFESNRAQISEIAAQVGMAIAAIADVVRDTVSAIAEHWGTIGTVLEAIWNTSGAGAIVAVIMKLNELRDSWQFVANDIIAFTENMVNRVVEALNGVLDRLGDFIEMIGSVGGKLLGLDAGAMKILEGGGLDPVKFGRFNAWPSEEEAMGASRGATEPLAKVAKAAIPNLSGMIGAGSAAKATKEADPLGDAIKRIQDKFTKDLAKAFIDGGESAMTKLAIAQSFIRKQISDTAASLVEKLGIDLPTALGFAAEMIGQTNTKIKDSVRNDLQGFLGQLAARRSAQGLNAIEGFSGRNGGPITINRTIGTLVVNGGDQQSVVSAMENADRPLLSQVRQTFAEAR